MSINAPDGLFFFLASTGVGAFIDFYLGKNGQKAVRNWIESLWVRLDDVRISTFSKDEAKIAHAILIKLFGSNISIRRSIAMLSVGSFGAAIWIIGKYFSAYSDESYIWNNFLGFDSENWKTRFIPIVFVCAVSMFWISVSLTVYFAKIISEKMPEKSYLNFLAFAVLLIFQVYLLIAVGYIPEQPLQQLYEGETIHESIGRLLLAFEQPMRGLNSWKETLFEFRDGWQELVSYMCFIMASFPNVLRLFLASLFLISYIFRPVRKFILLTLSRISESDKPIFTMMLGGVVGVWKVVERLVS